MMLCAYFFLCVGRVWRWRPAGASPHPSPAARATAAQVACPLDVHSLLKKQELMPPTLSLACLPFLVLVDEEGGGMSAQLLDSPVEPEASRRSRPGWREEHACRLHQGVWLQGRMGGLPCTLPRPVTSGRRLLPVRPLQAHSAVKAVAAAALLLAAAAKEQKQMLVVLPGVRHLATLLVAALEAPGAGGRLRPALARLGGAGGEPLLSFEQLLFAAHLLRWQANLTMLATSAAAPSCRLGCCRRAASRPACTRTSRAGATWRDSCRSARWDASPSRAR